MKNNAFNLILEVKVVCQHRGNTGPWSSLVLVLVQFDPSLAPGSGPGPGPGPSPGPLRRQCEQPIRTRSQM